MKKVTLFALFAALLSTPAWAQFQMATTEVTFPAPGLHAATFTNGVPARTWLSVDLKTIDPRFADVIAVDVDATLSIAGPGLPAINCQVWVEYGKPGAWPTTGDPGGNYQEQMLHDSRDVNPTYQWPRKRVALTNGVFYVAVAYEPGCLNSVQLAIVTALLAVPVAPDPSYTVTPTNVAVFDYPWQLAYSGTTAPVAPDIWHTIDLKTVDPRFAGVTSVRVEGILIQGPTQSGQMCYLDVYLKPQGGGVQAHYFSQAPSDGGARISVPDRITMPFYDVDRKSVV